MVHQLDLKTSTARCIDLPGTGDFNATTTWAMELSPNGKTLWAVNPSYGRVVGIDVAKRNVRVAFRFKKSALYDNGPASSISAISPDGSRMRRAAEQDLLRLDLAKRVVVKGVPEGGRVRVRALTARRSGPSTRASRSSRCRSCEAAASGRGVPCRARACIFARRRVLAA